jgi:hypothetical protein
MTRVILKRVLGERPTGGKNDRDKADREIVPGSRQRINHKKLSEK